MSEETTQTPVQSNATAPVAVASKSASSITLKDFFIPLSIVIAGALMGAGLFFSGSNFTGSQPQLAQNNQQQPAVAVDTTSKINGVTDADHIKGDINAPVKIVEFSDFDCPYCSRFHDSMNEFVESSDGNVAWVYRHFPLEQLHPKAPTVAHASECVAELGGGNAFWIFTDGYFEARGAGDSTEHQALMIRLAGKAGVSTSAFNDCMDSERHKQAIQDDMSDALETGGRGTPWSIVIGPTGKTYPINGAQPAAVIEQVVKLAIEEAK